MATGRERRAERLNERLRGAQRANVGDDDSFHLDIPGLGGIVLPAPPKTSSPIPEPEPEPRPEQEPDLEPDIAQPLASPTNQGSPARPSAPVLEYKDPYALPNTSEESIARPEDEQQQQQWVEESSGVEDEAAQDSTQNESIAQPAARSPELEKQPAEESEVESAPDSSEPMPPPTPEPEPAILPVRPRVSLISPMRGQLPRGTVDEVEESPMDAPGSGQRRRIQSSEVVSSNTRLHDALDVDDDVPQSSSPLARKVRRSSVASKRLSSKLAERSEIEDASPDRTRPQERSSSPTVGAEDQDKGEEAGEEEVEEEQEMDEGSHPSVGSPAAEQDSGIGEEEEAEEITAVEAAKTLGKRRRRSIKSPELGSQSRDEQEDQGADEEEPLPKRRRGRPTTSPATQKQGVPKVKPTQKSSSRSTEVQKKPKSKPKGEPSKRKPKRESGDGDGQSIEITVQRFVNFGNLGDNNDNEDDPLLSDMPFANRVGETVVDVFAQVCMEVIDTTISQFEELVGKTEDRNKKKEARFKAKTLEAYREELNTRLLQHTIHLNDWQSLRKRVRHVQKEKLSLREEIMGLKAEREQVALQMDAVRMKHEEDSKRSTFRLNTSTLMHDVDLAIEQGRDAPELTPKELKDAELANLELLISQICDEASSASATGGILNQVRDFNAFLERAAMALESR